MDIYRSRFTAAQIEASIGKSPIIDEFTGEWKVYDIATGEYVTTGIMADSEIAAARAETAQGKAEDAQTAAETALTHAPKIQSGTWWVWDATEGAYVDTEVEATGSDGFSPTATVTQSGDVTTISITDKNGTTEAEIDLSDYDQSEAIADHVTKLPDGYREVEYAESDATQYISLGYHASLNYRMICRFRLVVPIEQATSIQYVFGARRNSTSYAYCIYANNNGIFANYDTESYKLADYDNNIHTVEFVPDTVNSKMEFMLDGIKVNEAALNTTDQTLYNIQLFAVCAYPNTAYPGACGIYSLRVWDENGVLKTDCVPCVRESDGEVGIYDVDAFRTATLSSETKLAAGGEMIMRNTYNRLEDAERNISGILPAAPSADGTYKLTCTVASGVITYSWEVEE